MGALCIVVGVFHGEKVAAQQNPPTQRVPARFVVTGDMVNFASPSSYMFIGWMTNANCLIQIGFDATSNILRLQRPERYLSRVGVAALFGSVSLLVDRAFSLTAHDAAHMDAARSIGSTYVALVTPNAEAEMSIWDFLLYSFDPTREPGLYLYEKPHLTYREHAFVAGAGLDTNLLIASKMADKVVRGEGHLAVIGDGHLDDREPFGGVHHPLHIFRVMPRFEAAHREAHAAVINPHAVAELAAEQLVHRQARRLACYVPESHLDCADRAAPRFERTHPADLKHGVLDLRGIFTEEKIAVEENVRLQIGLGRLCFPESLYSFVRCDSHDRVVPDDCTLEVSDFQLICPSWSACR